ncbi:MAG: DUF4249 domain-containing protein [Porphyromonadaceae bacterium]|nr:DUF4249 domain-containing protein [Porphyromonadaceae bacterium]
MKQLTKILLISSLALSSCKKVIDISQDDARRDLTVIFSGSTAEGLAPQTMRISRTDFVHFRLKQNAKITLYVDGQSVPVVPAQGDNAKGVYTLSHAFAPGQTATLRVEEGGDVVTAKAQVPQLPLLLDFDVEEVEEEASRGYGYRNLLWRVRMMDRAGESNYYRISATIQPVYENVDTGEELTLGAAQSVRFDGREDPIISEGRPQSGANSDFDLNEILQGSGFTNTYTAFSDVLFLDKEVELKLKSKPHDYHYPVYFADPNSHTVVNVDGALTKVRYKYHRYTLSLHATTEDMYRYLRTLGQASVNMDDTPFVAPIQIYSNISGGAGIFAINSVVTKTKLKRSN